MEKSRAAPSIKRITDLTESMLTQDTKRLSRLVAILTHLQAKRLLTASELADTFSVSPRTIYRDIRALEQAGVPIVTEEGKGYSLLEGYRLPPVMFTESEAYALMTAEQLVLGNGDTSFVRAFTEAVTKIKAVIGQSVRDKASLLRNRILIRHQPGREFTSNYLAVLQLALVNTQCLEIKYSDKAGHVTGRIIEPFALYSDGGTWLLFAYCRLRGDFRAFRLDRIQKLMVLKETFPHRDMSLQEFFQKKYTTLDI